MSTNIDLMDLDRFVEGSDLELFAHLRREDPVHWNAEPDGPGFWSLTRYDDVKAVASDPAQWSSAQGTQIQGRRAEGSGAPSIHNMDPPRHRALRKLMSPNFGREVIQRNRGRVHEVVAEHLDRALELGRCDWVSTVSHHIPILVFATLLGAPKQDAPKLLDWTNKTTGQEDPEVVADPSVAVRARDDLFSYFHDLVEARRAQPADDLVSALASGEIDGAPLGPDELDPYFLLLVVAGNETTRNLLSGLVLAFDEFPDELARLKAGRVASVDAVEELLRYVSPVMCMRRTAVAATEVAGTAIAKDDKVVLWWCSANRDATVFEHPDALVLDRSPNKHLGFGWGIHFCLGSQLARLEAEVLLDEITRRDLRIDVAGPVDRLRSNFFRGIKRLPVEVSAGA